MIKTERESRVPLEEKATQIDGSGLRGLYLVFVAAYVLQAWGRHKSPLMGLTIKNYYVHQVGFTATQVADYLLWLAIPWTIKPVLGFVSDIFPLFGYRRRSYMVVVAAISLIVLAALWFTDGAWSIRVLLFATSSAIAFSDVLADAMTVILGHRTGLTAKFQSAQWIAYSVAGLGGGFLGGILTDWFDPITALRISATLSGLAALVLCFAAYKDRSEARSGFSFQESRSAAKDIFNVLRSATLWKVALVVFLVRFAPNLGSAYYVFRADVLKLTGSQIGVGEMLTSFGGVVGALIYARLSTGKLDSRQLFIRSLVLGSLSILSYAFVQDAVTSYVAGFAWGVLEMVSGLALLLVITEACPDKAAGFAFALMASFSAVALQMGDQIGARIFDSVSRQIYPLAVISGLTTLAALLLQGLIPRNMEARSPVTHLE